MIYTHANQGLAVNVALIEHIVFRIKIKSSVQLLFAFSPYLLLHTLARPS